MLHPSLARARAVALPIPRDAPVTTATLPSKRISFTILPCNGSHRPPVLLKSLDFVRDLGEQLELYALVDSGYYDIVAVTHV